MPDENTVSLKVYLIEGSKNTEVRRFEVDQGVITNFDYVRERLQMAIPKLREKPFKVLWQDSDGDEVTISSDEELMIALSEHKSTVVKLIVRFPFENSEPETHISIGLPNMYDIYSSVANWAEACPLFAEMQNDQICQACQQPITGFKYRCLECVQYYQCGDCEHKNSHPDHLVLRMSKNPSLSTLVPKCIQILKGHFIRGMRCPAMAFKDRMSHCHRKDDDKDKERRGHHHHKKFRKFEKHGGEKEYKDKHSNEPMGECPFNPQMFNNLGDVVGAFLGMYKDVQKKPENAKQGEKDGPSTSKTCPMKNVEVPGAPPMPASPIDITMDEDETCNQQNAETQKDAKIKMAIELLTEMGFNDENKWLSRLLEHFDGDIAKTIDHLTLGK